MQFIDRKIIDGKVYLCGEDLLYVLDCIAEDFHNPNLEEPIRIIMNDTTIKTVQIMRNNIANLIVKASQDVN